MKITHKTLVIASLVSGFASLSFAGPGLQYWQNQNSATIQPAPNGACERMLAPNSGPTANKVPVVSVQCTPELMKNDALCQKNCGLTSAKSDASCEHMLIRSTGSNAGKVPYTSATCTPEMKANDPACQSHCRL
ncbi:MAG TPA: hypothetical protein VNV14_07445 [Opitutaceae bacterium]|nr:hypothetical protein [Opitutaceae bacterium]